MQQDSNIGGGYRPATAIGEDGYRVTCSVSVKAHLYEAGGLKRLIEGEAPDVAAARYGHRTVKIAEFLGGLFVLMSLATVTEQTNVNHELPASVADALNSMGELGYELSQEAWVCATELLKLYEEKGADDGR